MVYLVFLSDIIIDNIINIEDIDEVLGAVFIKTSVFYIVFGLICTYQSLKLLKVIDLKYIKTLVDENDLMICILSKYTLIKYNFILVITNIFLYITGNLIISISTQMGTNNPILVSYNFFIDSMCLVFLLYLVRPTQILKKFDNTTFEFEEHTKIYKVKISKKKLKKLYKNLGVNTKDLIIRSSKRTSCGLKVSDNKENSNNVNSSNNISRNTINNKINKNNNLEIVNEDITNEYIELYSLELSQNNTYVTRNLKMKRKRKKSTASPATSKKNSGVFENRLSNNMFNSDNDIIQISNIEKKSNKKHDKDKVKIDKVVLINPYYISYNPDDNIAKENERSDTKRKTKAIKKKSTLGKFFSKQRELNSIRSSFHTLFKDDLEELNAKKTDTSNLVSENIRRISDNDVFHSYKDKHALNNVCFSSGISENNFVLSNMPVAK